MKKSRLLKKQKKNFSGNLSEELINNLKFKLTINQTQVLDEINSDIKSNFKMFRLLQGDVGSGKTIVSLISALNVIESNFQVAFMAPTEILARQHFNLAKQLFPKNTKIKLLSSKSDKKW